MVPGTQHLQPSPLRLARLGSPMYIGANGKATPYEDNQYAGTEQCAANRYHRDPSLFTAVRFESVLPITVRRAPDPWVGDGPCRPSAAPGWARRRIERRPATDGSPARRGAG